MACKKLYYQDIVPECFLDQNLETMYWLKDYHRMYVGKIVKCWLKN